MPLSIAMVPFYVLTSRVQTFQLGRALVDDKIKSGIRFPNNCVFSVLNKLL